MYITYISMMFFFDKFTWKVIYLNIGKTTQVEFSFFMINS